MPLRRPNPEKSAADCRLLIDFYRAAKHFYPALIKEEIAAKLVGFTPAAMREALRLGLLVPAHEGQFKVKLFALIDIIKLMADRDALMKAARAGADAIEAKNKRAKAVVAKKAGLSKAAGLKAGRGPNHERKPRETRKGAAPPGPDGWILPTP